MNKIVILGGGFGGVKAALELCGDNNFDVTLISDRKDFRYYPTLFKAATGGKLSASSIMLNEILDGKNVHLVNDQAVGLDRAQKKVGTKSGKNYDYDILIIALGSVTNYFGIKGLEENAYGIKSVEEATRFRDHIHKLLMDEGKPDVNYIIIGGGPTGVELAGALPSYLKHILKSHGLQKISLHIDLVEAAPRILPNMPRRYSKAVTRRLRKLGVELYLNQAVKSETPSNLMIGEHSLASHSVVWTAGVANNPFLAANGFKPGPHGKIPVDEYLLAEDSIYVIGDNAATPYSGMAQTALYDAIFVTENLKAAVHGRKIKHYTAKKPITIIPVGPHWAAVSMGRWQFYGLLGWLLRSVADLIAYHDLEPWWKAGRHWLAEEVPGYTGCPECEK